MKSYATHILIAFIALVAGVSAPVTAYIMRPVVVAPDVHPVPVVDSFADIVADVWKTNSGESADACVLAEMFGNLQATLVGLDAAGQKIDTKILQDFTNLGNQIRYGKSNPFDDKYKFLRELVNAEIIQRGLAPDANGNGKPEQADVDCVAWAALYGELVEGLSR